METITIDFEKDYTDIIEYYNEAGPDYEAWSKSFNMHFGYGTWLNVFQREKMLEAMNELVLQKLYLNDEKSNVLDMGCGLGATLRAGAKKYPQHQFHGITIVPWQIKKATELNQKLNLADNINLYNGDYTNSPFPDNYFDGIYALESACHSNGSAKKDFIKELARILKPGKRFVIADGFLKNEQVEFPSLVNNIYKSLCNSWALPCLAQVELFIQCLKENNLREIEVTDISWKVAPSVIHAPFVTMKFILSKILQNEKLKKQSINNMRGALLTVLLGLYRPKFGYYFITGVKGE